MTILDVILLIILSGFIWFGLFFGFIHALGSLAGTVLGAWVAYKNYGAFGSWAAGYLGFENVAKVVAFLIIFAIVSRLVSFAFSLLDKFYNFLSIIPFLETINKLGGGALGLAEGCLSIGVVLVLLLNYPLASWLTSAIDHSQVAAWIMEVVAALMPFVLNIYDKAQVFIK